ncbi:ATP-dependent DNA ligase [Desulfosporosinus shakirovi]|uniref:ATP-dependent DNA ligase n=1 Tax=Desulfosporosinus shakirovi TaxID=2885154 RepID=UPI001E462686|nr:RNA ligase family protein [Desulfosporosinus sp. SRJS8]MCB8818627.1 ATP-dependent DNA ligase [Desulfosporosinus sp. SRJS8]
MFISPMLLHKVEDPFDDDEWLSELKLDGIRFLYSSIDTTKFYTRHGNEVTERFLELATNQVPKGTILDGEIIVSDENGKPDFETLMSRFHIRNSRRIPIISKNKPVTFCAFDVIYHKGKKVSHLPLADRKELLTEIIPEDLPRIAKTLSVKGNGKVLYDLVKSQDLEGIVLKRKDSKYEIGKRSQNWLKVINYKYDTVSIAGFRKSEFGWLLRFPDGRSAGVMELGVPAEARGIVFNLAKMVPVKETGDYIYFPDDSLKCKVKYRTLTKAGLLRLPSFLEFAS